MKNRDLYLQDFLWDDAVKAVKDSIKFNSFQEFEAYLKLSLSQNSEESRTRAAREIIRAYFPSRSMINLLTEVWRNYQDDILLKELMRYQYLSTTTLVAQFVTDYILPVEPGYTLQTQLIDNYILAKRGSISDKLRQRLTSAIEHLGFIQRQKNTITVSVLTPARTALFILVHNLFAPDPRVIAIKEILANQFWKYLGFRREDEVRSILKKAQADGFLAKYVIADQLEQINTRYMIREIMGRKIYL